MKTDRMDPSMMAKVEADAPFFHRMPRDIAEQVNPGVARLYSFSAGGRIRKRKAAELPAAFLAFFKHFVHNFVSNPVENMLQ